MKVKPYKCELSYLSKNRKVIVKPITFNSLQEAEIVANNIEKCTNMYYNKNARYVRYTLYYRDGTRYIMEFPVIDEDAEEPGYEVY